MKRTDYIFAIGFEGGTAIVDKRTRSRCASRSSRELADEGLFRVACRAVVYDESEEDAAYVLKRFNEISQIKYKKMSDLERLFGIQPPSSDIKGVNVV